MGSRISNVIPTDQLRSFIFLCKAEAYFKLALCVEAKKNEIYIYDDNFVETRFCLWFEKNLFIIIIYVLNN